MSRQWYYSKQNQRIGPIAEGQLQALAQSGELQPTDLVWAKGMTEWTPANAIKGLILPASAPPASDMGFLDNVQRATVGTHGNVATSPPPQPESATPVDNSPMGFLDTLQKASVSAGKRIAKKASDITRSDAVQSRVAAGKKKWLGLSRNQVIAFVTIGGVGVVFFGVVLLLLVIGLFGSGSSESGGGSSEGAYRHAGSGRSEEYQEGYEQGAEAAQGVLRFPSGERENMARKTMGDFQESLKSVLKAKSYNPNLDVSLIQGRCDGFRDTLAKNGVSY